LGSLIVDDNHVPNNEDMPIDMMLNHIDPLVNDEAENKLESQEELQDE
jgi:hypothetical protein